MAHATSSQLHPDRSSTSWIVEPLNRILSVFDARLVRASKTRPRPTTGLDPGSSFDHVRELLAGELNLIFLGSVGDRFHVPAGLADRIRIFSLDAFAPGTESAATTRIVPLTKVVCPTGGEVEFTERSVRGVSSLLEPDEHLIEAYGLEEFYRPVGEQHTQAVTLDALAREHHVETWDFVKTDLEGLDFEVVRSLGDELRRTTLLQMELRFEPFYRGEPPFHAVAAYLEGMGFQLLDLMPERWRYHTEHELAAVQGHTTFCNALFLNRQGEHESDAALVRKALVLGLLGYANDAEWELRPLASRRPEVLREFMEWLFPAESAHTRFLPVPDHPHVTHSAAE